MRSVISVGLAVGATLVLADTALAERIQRAPDEGRRCQVAAMRGERTLARANTSFDRAFQNIQDAVIDVAQSCPSPQPSWLEAALTDLAACEAACTATYNACSAQIPCNFLCQLGCSLDRLACNTGCNAVFAARAADCAIIRD